MKATTSFRLGPTLGLGLRMGERPKPRPKSFPKTASSHHLKKGHLDGSAISPGCMPLSEPAARERVSPRAPVLQTTQSPSGGQWASCWSIPYEGRSTRTPRQLESCCIQQNRIIRPSNLCSGTRSAPCSPKAMEFLKSISKPCFSQGGGIIYAGLSISVLAQPVRLKRTRLSCSNESLKGTSILRR